MADEKRVVRTAGVSGEFRLPGLLETDDGPADLVITPEGTEVTQEQWLAVAEAATTNHVIVRLDEDFPVAVESTPETETQSPPPDGDSSETKTEEPQPNAGPPPPAPAVGSTSRKGR
jgi:hypothetical protein